MSTRAWKSRPERYRPIIKRLQDRGWVFLGLSRWLKPASTPDQAYLYQQDQPIKFRQWIYCRLNFVKVKTRWTEKVETYTGIAPENSHYQEIATAFFTLSSSQELAARMQIDSVWIAISPSSTISVMSLALRCKARCDWRWSRREAASINHQAFSKTNTINQSNQFTRKSFHWITWITSTARIR